MSDGERFIRAFHAARPGVTQRVFARGGTYARLAERVPPGRVLDLACGDGPLLRLLGPRATGIDISLDELMNENSFIQSDVRRPTTSSDSMNVDSFNRVQARAQALPFADQAFDAATCHLAFMLFDEIEQVVAELARVLKPGAPFIALLGGGPTAEGRDAYHAYAERLPYRCSLGDRRASSEGGWRELFAGWSGDIAFERWPIDFSGTFAEVWELLAATYAHPPDDAAIREGVRAEFPGDRVPCTFVTFLATVRR